MRFYLFLWPAGKKFSRLRRQAQASVLMRASTFYHSTPTVQTAVKFCGYFAHRFQTWTLRLLRRGCICAIAQCGRLVRFWCQLCDLWHADQTQATGLEPIIYQQASGKSLEMSMQLRRAVATRHAAALKGLRLMW